jgi:hypothetical protein
LGHALTGGSAEQSTLRVACDIRSDSAPGVKREFLMDFDSTRSSSEPSRDYNSGGRASKWVEDDTIHGTGGFDKKLCEPFRHGRSMFHAVVLIVGLRHIDDVARVCTSEQVGFCPVAAEPRSRVAPSICIALTPFDFGGIGLVGDSQCG